MLALADLRRHVLAAQRYATRFRRADADDVEAAVRRLSCVQLDSIVVVDRSHRLVLGSRVGAPPAGVESRLLGSGRLVEYWGHEASLLPADAWPLFRHRMEERAVHHWWGDVIGSDRPLARRVLARIESEGPLSARAFEGASRGGMWRLKPAKRMLDALWTAGRLVVSGREGFERVYDLPGRVLPPRVLDAPAPPRDEAIDALIVRAVEARGALTGKGVADHFRLGAARDVRPRLDALVEAGRLRREPVDDGGPDVFLPPGAEPEAAPAPRASVLLSPFENLLWDRAFARRLFGFDHLIEVYKPAPQRAWGYYVMPWLHGDRIAGRMDLKSDRAAGVLRVRALHLEPGVAWGAAMEETALRALGRLARQLGLEAPERAPRPRVAQP